MDTGTILSFPKNGQILKPIETRYNGEKYRSRLEARWAVFFVELGVTYRYELEGYNLGEAGLYLPDFWLPDSETYVEIKPQKPNEKEVQKARAMHLQSGKDVVILYGDRLEPHCFEAIIFPEDKAGKNPSANALRFIKHLAYCELRKSARALLTYLDCMSVYPEASSSDLRNQNSNPLVMFKKTPADALNLAREARFERGRNGT